MNLQTLITVIICSICGVVCAVLLIYGLIKYIKIRQQRYKRFGYHTLTSKQQVNTLKTKARYQVKIGTIPSVFEELYDTLTIDSPVKNAKFLNKLVKRYRKKRGYYKKRVNENINCAINIKLRYSQFLGVNK